LRLLHGRSAVNSSTGRRNTAGGWSSVRSAVNSNTGDHATKFSSTLLPGLTYNDFGTLLPVLVIVDQDHPNAADAPDCGISPERPCSTIRFGTTRVQANGTVMVNGGVYSSECSGSGILINASLSVIGVGMPVVDCQHTGAGAFHLNTYNRTHGDGPEHVYAVLSLDGLVVQIGPAISADGLVVVNHCVFKDSSITIYAPLQATDCNFIGNSTKGYGGGIQVYVVHRGDDPRLDVPLLFTGCTFIDVDGVKLLIESGIPGTIDKETSNVTSFLDCVFANTNQSSTT